MCPPVSPYKGASIVKSPRTMRVFLVWKRHCSNIRVGTQAPPLRFRLGGLRVDGWLRLSRLRVDGWFRLGQIVRGCITEMGRGRITEEAELRVYLLHQTHGFGLFHEQGHEWFALVGHLIVEHGILQGLF